MNNTYWRILRFARPLGRYAVPYFFCTLFYTVFSLFTFMLLMPLLNYIFGLEDAAVLVTEAPKFTLSIDYLQDVLFYWFYRIFGTDGNPIQMLVMIASIIISASLISNLARYLGQWIIEKLKITTLRRLRNDVFDNVINLQVGFFSNERKGDIISKITSDVQVIQYCVSSTLQVIFRDPFHILVYLFGMVIISWELTIFSVLFLPLVALIIGSIVKRLRKPAAMAQERFGDIVSLLDESLGGIKIIKGYNATGYIRNKFHQINDAYSRIMRSMAKRQQLASPVSEFLGVSALAVLLIFGGALVVNGKLNAGAFVTYLGIFSQITRPLRSFADAFSNINQGIAAGERVLALLDEESTITDAPDAIEFPGLKEQIEFRDVQFSYEDKPIICGVNFTIKKGQTVALVGPSGGGKSTLSDLIPRFYDIQGGELLIDDVGIQKYSLQSLRAHMGIVAQETILFNDTIENNLRLGKRDATLQEIEYAAKAANAHNFILETENGYQTNIGDRGMKLSGGQRQRLSIARAILKNPDILILDEATSALDTESEKLVQGALNSLLKGRTSLVIAHRLSTIHDADHIIVIDQGRIAEEGTHNELMKRKGIYCKLIEMQQLA